MSEEQKPALINIKDLSGLGAPLTKLIETIQAGFGGISSGISRVANAYWLASKDAHNEAERIRLIEGVKTEVQADRVKAFTALSTTHQQELKTLDITNGEVSVQFIGMQPELASAQERSKRRLEYQNAMHQLNLDAIVAEAASVLAEETQVDEQPVNQDWINRFSRYAEDISTEDMQTLWGKILAGEIKKPNSFSLRTLEVLRNLSEEEAKAFADICNYIIELRNKGIATHILYKGSNPFSSIFLWQRVEYNKILLLMECGLLQSDDNATYSIGFEPNKDVRVPIKVGSVVILVTGINTREGKLLFPVYNLTKAGKELSTLVSLKTPLDYSFDFAKPFQAFDLKVEYSSFSHWGEDDSLHILDALQDVPDIRNG